ncbi:unnamed protein product, partial [Urochloa humidicola]
APPRFHLLGSDSSHLAATPLDPADPAAPRTCRPRRPSFPAWPRSPFPFVAPRLVDAARIDAVLDAARARRI